VGRSSRRWLASPTRADTSQLIKEVEQMTRKARIAHLAGPNATIQNTPPLVTSNKARVKHQLPPLTNPDGSPARFDVLRAQRLAAPVTIYVEQFSAHPLEADAAELYGPPDGYIDSAGQVHREQQSADDKPVYEVELRPEDGLYPLPYMALQADGAAWEEECAFPNAPEPKARQGFFSDGSRSFEEIDRLQIGEHGTGNLISGKAEIDFYRILPPSGYTKGLSADRRTDTGSGDIPPERRGVDFFPYSPRTSPPRCRVPAWRARPMPSNRSSQAANMTARSGPRAARGSRRRSTGSTS
jgi:L-asparaginase